MKTRGPAVTALVLALVASPVHAGNVVATYSQGTLTLAGGDGDDAVTITAPAADSVQVTPVAPTTVNGNADPQSFGAITDLVVALGLGTNAVTVTNTPIARSVNMKGGAGNETLALDGSSVGKDVYAQLGAGANGLTFANGTIGGALKYKGGAGTDQVTLTSATVGTKATLTLGAGDNTAALTSVTADTSLAYTGGSGIDLVDFTTVATTKGKLSLAGGAGENRFTLSGLGVGSDFAYKGGAGDDIVQIDGATIGDDVTASVGAAFANNVVSLDGGTIGGNVKFRGGSGTDSLGVFADVAGSVSADLGGQNNHFTAGAVTIGSIAVKGGGEIDNAGLNGTHVTKHVKLVLGNGANLAGLDGATVDGNFTIKTGAGNDGLAFANGTVVHGTQTIELGGGTNSIVMP